MAFALRKSAIRSPGAACMQENGSGTAVNAGLLGCSDKAVKGSDSFLDSPEGGSHFIKNTYTL